jgi:hypothetical protein
MSLEALVSKYIASTEKVLKGMQRNKGTINVTEENVAKILGYVTDYVEDAKYYKAQKSLKQV